MAVHFTREIKLLFIGDSITDAGRASDAEGIGNGYVRMIRDGLRAEHPENSPQVINRGVSGNKITDLRSRWLRDVIELRPDVLSIMIGINDVWHEINPEWRPGVGIDLFVETYRELLRATKTELPKCELVLCEPTVIWPPQEPHANAALRPYVDAVNEIAREFQIDHVVHLHEAFNRAKQLRPDIAWCPDGVHPSSSGHALIAREWLGAIEA